MVRRSADAGLVEQTARSTGETDGIADGAASDGDETPTAPGQRLSRRAVLGSLAGIAAAGLSMQPTAGQRQPAGVPTPTVEGPIQGGSVTGGPQTAAPHDVSRYGYVEEEYFVAGEARHDDYFLDGDAADRTTPYRTRVLVYRPARPRGFDGSVYAEWLNVSTQVDAPVAWPNAYQSLVRHGTAVALVSAQKVGVDDSANDQDLVTWDPDRYGDLHHPGDEYAVDIFAQAVSALDRGGGGGERGRGRGRGSNRGRGRGRGRDHGRGQGRDRGRGRGRGRGPGGSDGDDPMGGLDPQTLLAVGHSQSAFMLLRYVNMAAPTYGLIDGFLPAGSPLMTARVDQAPILWLNSEDEAVGLADFGEGADFGSGEIDFPLSGTNIEAHEPGPREDQGQFRLWEVPGGSHINHWLAAWSLAVRARDFQGGQANWNPYRAGQYGENPDRSYGQCGSNYFPMRYAWRAALQSLRGWVEDGDVAVHADRIEREETADGGFDIKRDEHGNARGGLRMPVLEAPVARYDATSCGLTGRTVRFDESTLADLYPSHADYVRRLRRESLVTVRSGHMRMQDAIYLIGRAIDSPVGR